MEKKKILYIHQSAGGGGASTSLFLLINDIINKSKYEPLVVFGRPGPFEVLLRKRGVKTYVRKLAEIGIHTHSPKISATSMLLFIIRFIPNIIFIYKIIRNESVSFVHLNSSVLIGPAISSYLARSKVIWHMREVIPSTKIGRLQKWLIKYIASDIITSSKEVDKKLDGNCNTTLIYNGIDPKAFRPNIQREAIIRKYELNKAKTIFTHISQLYPARGTYIFLKAAKILNLSGYNSRFLVIGGSNSNQVKDSFSFKVKKVIRYLLWDKDINWKKEFESFALNEGIAESVIFTGWRSDIPNFISLSDVIVVPNLIAEGFGRVLIEAGSLGKPVISTKISPSDEIVVDGETGILVKPDDPESLAEAMKYIADNPTEARQMGEAGYLNVIRNFHIDSTHGKIYELYNKYFMSSS